MRRIVHLDSMMSQYGLHSKGSYWGRHGSSTVHSLHHKYEDEKGGGCEVTEVFPKGNEYSVIEIKFSVDGKFVPVKSYKQMFKYLKEKMLESIMNQ